MSELSVVDCPAFQRIAKSLRKSIGYLLQVNIQSADSNFYEVSLVDEQFEVVPPSSFKHFSAKCGLEAAPLPNLACQIFIVEYEFAAGSLGVPRKECWITIDFTTAKALGNIDDDVVCVDSHIIHFCSKNVIGALVGKHYTTITYNP